MRITYDNTPVLKSLKNDEYFPRWDISEFKKTHEKKWIEIYKTFSKHREDFKNVHIVSLNYAKSAFYKAEGFLKNYRESIGVENKVNPKGTFIRGQFVYFYYATALPIENILFVFTRSARLVSCIVLNENLQINWVSKDLLEKGRNANISSINTTPLLFWVFKHTNLVEEKIVARDKKVKCEGEEMPVMNKLDFDLIHLNSMYYTEIIRNEAFGVTGHYRYYPPKLVDGEWIPHIVWIHPYMKKGYHRRPQKTIENQKS